LVEYFTDILQPLFDDRPVVVWYDPEGVLEAPLRAAAEQRGWGMVPASGAVNPLAARVEIEEQIRADGLQWLTERRWLIYIAGRRHQPSWYEDFELIGRTVQNTLAGILAERHTLPPDKVADLVKGPAARQLVEKWSVAFPTGTWHLSLEQLGAALLALAFDEPAPFSPSRAVLRFLQDAPRYGAVLQEAGLTGTFIHVIQTQLGFGRLPESDEIRPAILVRAMMASELVHKGACELGPALHNFLPQKSHIPTWAAMAEAAVKGADSRVSFLQMAQQVEAETHLVQQATNLKNLTKAVSIPSVDSRLLEEAVARCHAAAPATRKDVYSELRGWADERLKLRTIGLEINDAWAVVASAAGLLIDCEAAESALAGLASPSPDNLIARYADHNNGWWRIDALHRGLELRFETCRADLVEELGQPALAAVWRWSRHLASAFAAAFEGRGQYNSGLPDLIPQHRFWSQLVETADLGETAILYVDALRIDLAEELLKRLDQPGRQIASRLGLVSLPSRTPVGMASLLPRGESLLSVVVNNGALRAEIDNRDVTNPDGRTDQLRQLIASVQVGELKKVTETQLTQWATAKNPVVLMTRDIDDSGEIAATVAPDLFEDLVEDLTRWITVLHRAGYRRVVIGTDHGFLLVPADGSFDEVTAPSRAANVSISNRYAVGPLASNPDCVAFEPAEMGRSGTDRVLLPRGLAVFKIPGPRKRFLHGGLSPQECVVRFIISTLAGPPATPALVRLARLTNITSLVLYLQTEVTSSGGPAQARRVRAEARTGGRVIGRSEATVYKPPSELAPNESYPKLKVVLSEQPATVDLVLLDEDSGEVLDTQSDVVNVMRREVDDDLL
jgi:hypothetical protein